MASEIRRVPGMWWMEWVDNDHIAASVDGERTIFSRDDCYGGQAGSGVAYFGSVVGDHRMIAAIAEHVETAFQNIDAEVSNGN
jgi:hypothetical protein